MPPFLSATKGFRRQYTSLFDFVSVAAPALWNMRWQVRGFLDVNPQATKTELMGHFVHGSSIVSANLRRYSELPFESQLEQLGRLQLYTAISLYERWLEGLPFLRATDRKILQRPKAHGRRDYNDVIRDAQSAGSSVMEDFRSVLEGDSFCAINELNELLIAFRAFKEIRNVFTHRGEEPDESLLASYNAMISLPNLPFGKSPRGKSLPYVVQGKEVRVTLNGAFSACTVVLRVVMTLDAKFALCAIGEGELLARWQERYNQPPTIQRRRLEDGRRTRGLIGSTGLPQPDSADLLQPFLIDRGLLRVM